MDRRRFLNLAMQSGIGLACAPWLVNAATTPYGGQFLLTIEAGGGWDTTLHMDPKVNQPGEKEITHWSNTADIQTVGEFSIAPVINNEQFYTKFKNDLLVINGVDTQTNSHTTGIIHSFTGRNAEGFPVLPALFAAANASHLPFSYISMNGFAKTSNLIVSSRISGGGVLKRVLLKEGNPETGFKRPLDETELILKAQAEHYDMIKDSDMLPRYKKAMENFENAKKLSPSLDPFMDSLPNDGEFFQGSNPVMSQAQLALLAFNAGVSSSCSMAAYGGYDSHQNNDSWQYENLTELNKTIEYIWDYAAELGIENRLTVVVTSDFCRTPYYNSADGKDHWNTNSYLVMQKNAPWANRVVGASDHLQTPLAINPNTLQIDSSSNGVIMTPSHIHQSLRQLLNIDSHEYSLRYPFKATENIPIFTSSQITKV